MIFTDDEARHSFHKSSTLLQVVCQMLESELTAHHMQLEFVSVDFTDGQWEALLVVDSETFEDSPSQQEGFRAAVATVNKRMARRDGEDTVEAEEGNFGLVTVRVTGSRDFALAN